VTDAAPTFLRLDRPELDGTTMIVRMVPPGDRERRRTSPSAPLAYFYETVMPDEPHTDMRMNAGHYDETALVWSFSGDITAIAGITAPMTPGMTVPGEQMEVHDVRTSTDQEPAAHVPVHDDRPRHPG
jgi:hypothetical protein